MAGWGNYVKKSKTPAELDLQRRRELGLKHYSDIDELIAIASASKKKITRLPTAPNPDDDIYPAPEKVAGPCQQHVQFFKNRRAAIAAGKLPEVVVEDAPYVSEREAQLEASREYHRERARRIAMEPPGRLKRRTAAVPKVKS